jgi:myo-inositol 2-dehydrogenase/D-chiro-inositol 1-dehydrogenase
MAGSASHSRSPASTGCGPSSPLTLPGGGLSAGRAPTAPVRFALVGYGAWGRHHAAAIRQAPGAVLAGIACGSERSAAAARHDHPDVSVVADYHALLGRPDIDAVDVVVPNDRHVEVATAALARGKDVLLEKPMAPTVEGCDRLLDAARQSGRVLSIGHEFRLSTQWGAIRRLLDAGELGRPLYALVSLFRFPYRQGSGGWRYDPARVGSWILEEPVHFFDLVMWYFEGLGDPTSVLAVGNAKPRPEATGRMADDFSAVVRFPGGAYAVVTQTLAGFEHHQVVEVVGTEGSARAWWSGTMDRTRQPAFDLHVQRRGREAPEPVALGASGELFELEEELRQTVAAFRDRRALVPGEEARKRIVVCLEAERSLHEGREVPLRF